MKNTQKDYLSVSDLAEEFGIHEMTFYRMIKDKKIPTYKIGSQWRVKRTDFEKWLKERSSTGFTLIDVIITIAILTILAVAIGPQFVNVHKIMNNECVCPKEVWTEYDILQGERFPNLKTKDSYGD